MLTTPQYGPNGCNRRFTVTLQGKAVQDVDSLPAASEAVRAYLVAYDMGASKWNGGKVRDNSTGQVVARVSFNGRLWTPEPWPTCKPLVTT